MAWRRLRCSLVIIVVWPFAILGVVGAVFDIAMHIAKLWTGRRINMFVYLPWTFRCGPAIIVALPLYICSIVHAVLLIVIRSVRNGIGWHTKRYVGRCVGDGWCAAFCDTGTMRKRTSWLFVRARVKPTVTRAVFVSIMGVRCRPKKFHEFLFIVWVQGRRGSGKAFETLLFVYLGLGFSAAFPYGLAVFCGYVFNAIVHR